MSLFVFNSVNISLPLAYSSLIQRIRLPAVRFYDDTVYSTHPKRYRIALLRFLQQTPKILAAGRAGARLAVWLARRSPSQLTLTYIKQQHCT